MTALIPLREPVRQWASGSHPPRQRSASLVGEGAPSLLTGTELTELATRHPDLTDSERAELARDMSVIRGWVRLRRAEHAELHQRIARRWPLIPPPQRVAERPAVNSLGETIAATEQGLAAFWAWFGDSVVVDEHGRPFVMYTGGTDMLGPLVEFSGTGTGFCFGSLTSIGKNTIALADNHGHRPVITASYLRLCNPLIVDRGRTPDGRRWSRRTPAEEKVEIVADARARGHDGGIGGFAGVFLAGAVLDPAQVKAVDTFTNPDLYP